MTNTCSQCCAKCIIIGGGLSRGPFGKRIVVLVEWVTRWRGKMAADTTLVQSGLTDGLSENT